MSTEMSVMCSSEPVFVCPRKRDGRVVAPVSVYWLMRPSVSHARRYTPVKLSGLDSLSKMLPGALLSPAIDARKADVPIDEYLFPPGERCALPGRLAPLPATPSDCAEMKKSPSRVTARKGDGDASPPTRPVGAASARDTTLPRVDCAAEAAEDAPAPMPPPTDPKKLCDTLPLRGDAGRLAALAAAAAVWSSSAFLASTSYAAAGGTFAPAPAPPPPLLQTPSSTLAPAAAAETASAADCACAASAAICAAAACMYAAYDTGVEGTAARDGPGDGERTLSDFALALSRALADGVTLRAVGETPPPLPELAPASARDTLGERGEGPPPAEPGRSREFERDADAERGADAERDADVDRSGVGESVKRPDTTACAMPIAAGFARTFVERKEEKARVLGDAPSSESP